MPPPMPLNVPVATDFYGQPVGFGQPVGQYGGTTAVLGRLVDEGAVRSARRATVWALAGGVFALVVGGVLAIVRARAMEAGLSQSSGHYLATGGLLTAAIAFVRAGRSYRVMVDQGGERWTPAGKVVAFGTAGLALVLALVGVGQVVRASTLPPLGPAVAGSCWSGQTEAGGALRVLQVRCENPHEFVGTLVVRDSTGEECPELTDSVLDLADGTGYYLCLSPDLTPGT